MENCRRSANSVWLTMREVRWSSSTPFGWLRLSCTSDGVHPWIRRSGFGVKIARADFDEDSKSWTLWAYDRNDRPQRYTDLPAVIDFDTILGEIDHDPKCIIWG